MGDCNITIGWEKLAWYSAFNCWLWKLLIIEASSHSSWSSRCLSWRQPNFSNCPFSCWFSMNVCFASPQWILSSSICCRMLFHILRLFSAPIFCFEIYYGSAILDFLSAAPIFSSLESFTINLVPPRICNEISQQYLFQSFTDLRQWWWW